MRTMEPTRWQAGRMLVPLLGVLAALAMGVAAVAIVLQTQERDKRQAKERELELAVAENHDLQAQLEDSQQARARVEEDLGRTRKELAKSQEEIAKAVEAQEALSRSVEDRQREIDRLTKDLDDTHTELKRIGAQFADLQAQRSTMQQQVADLENAKSQLEEQLAEASSRPTVELEKVLVTDGGAAGGVSITPVPPTSQGIPDGQVVVVNREYDFIVMNLGRHHGLSVGQEFQIVRGNNILGRVKVEKVYDELSAAAILPDSQKDSIREGDAVKAL